MTDPRHRDQSTDRTPTPNVIALMTLRERRIEQTLAAVEVALNDCANDPTGEYRLCTMLGSILADRMVKLGGHNALEFLIMNIHAAGTAAVAASSSP